MSSPSRRSPSIDRRSFLHNTTAAAVAVALPGRHPTRRADDPDLAPVFAQVLCL